MNHKKARTDTIVINLICILTKSSRIVVSVTCLFCAAAIPKLADIVTVLSNNDKITTITKDNLIPLLIIEKVVK
ncbi:MAG: hypothetical protein ACJ72V_01065 [Nitrososphaeraceae archaeon]